MCTRVWLLECVCVCGGQARGVKGRFPDHLLQIFLERQSTLEQRSPTFRTARTTVVHGPLAGDRCLRGPSGRHLLVCISFQLRFRLRTAALVQGPTQAWYQPREVRGGLLHRSCEPRPSLSPALQPCPLPRSQWALWEPVVRDPQPPGGQQLPRAWRKEAGMRRRSGQHLTCSLELAWGETGCHPGKWQCPAANPAPEQGLTYPNSPEQNAVRMVWGKGCGWRSPETAEGPRAQPPLPPPASHSGLLCCLDSGPASPLCTSSSW